MAGKRDRVKVDVHLDRAQFDAIEDYRRRQATIPSRMEAIRDVIEAGLELIEKENKEAAAAAAKRPLRAVGS